MYKYTHGRILSSNSESCYPVGCESSYLVEYVKFAPIYMYTHTKLILPATQSYVLLAVDGCLWHIAPPTGSRPAQSTAPAWFGHLPASPITSQSRCLTLLHLQAPLLGELPPSCSYATSRRYPHTTNSTVRHWTTPLPATVYQPCPHVPTTPPGFPLLVLGNVEFSPPPPTLLQHPPDRDRAHTFKVNVHRHILHLSWLVATDSLWNQGHTAAASPSRLVKSSANKTWEYHPEFTRPIVSILLMFLSMSSYP